MTVPKARFDLKRLQLSEVTQTWIEWKCRISGQTPQEFLRHRLHEMALKELSDAKVGADMASAHGHKLDGAGQ